MRRRPRSTSSGVLAALVLALSPASSASVDGAVIVDPADPMAHPDYYESLRGEDSGASATLSNCCTNVTGSNLIELTVPGDDEGRTYRLADVAALLPYTFGGGGGSSSSPGDPIPRSSVQDHAAALLLACYHHNNGLIPSVLSSLPDHLLKAYSNTNIRLTASIHDTQFSPIQSTRLLTEVLDGQPTRESPLPQAILGAYRSASTSPTAILSGVNGIPQLSYHSSGTDFDNKEQYPLFGRTVPSSGADARAVVDYLQTLGVQYLGVIFVTDAFGSAYQKSLQDAAGEADPPIRTDSVSFSYKSASTNAVEVGPDGNAAAAGEGVREIENAIQSLRNTRYRYFVAIVGEEHYSSVMKVAHEQGIAGGDYVWLFTGGVDRDTFQERIARYKKGSPLAVATNGIGFIQVEGGPTSNIAYADRSKRSYADPDAAPGGGLISAESGYHRFRRAWKAAVSDPLLVEHFRSKQSDIRPEPAGYNFTTVKFSEEPSKHTYFVYDAVASLGLGMALAGSEEFAAAKAAAAAAEAAASEDDGGGGDDAAVFDSRFPTGTDIYDALRNNVTFEGASGDVRISAQSGTREYGSVTYTVWNARETELSAGDGEGGEATVGFDLVPTSHYVARDASAAASAEGEGGDGGEDTEGEAGGQGIVVEWVPVPGHLFLYADGEAVPPEQLPPVKAQPNHIGKSGRIAGLVLMGVVVLLSLLAALWTAVQRRSRVVRASRPLFLVLVSAGCLIMASAIVPLSQEETTVKGPEGLDKACMAAPWLYVLGFAICFSALFTKTWTLNKVYHNPDIDCIMVTWKDLLKTLTVLLVVNIALLLSWTLVSPLQWQRLPKDSKDAFDRTTETYATCTSDNMLPFVVVVIVINLGALLFANFQAYQARDIQTEYQESRYVAISMASILQAWCMGIPIMIVVKDAPQAKFFVEAGIIFVTCTAVLLLIFIPKLLAVRNDRKREEEERRRKMMREVDARAGRGQFDEEEFGDEEEEDSNDGMDKNSDAAREDDKKERMAEAAVLPKDSGGSDGGVGTDEENPQAAPADSPDPESAVVAGAGAAAVAGVAVAAGAAAVATGGEGRFDMEERGDGIGAAAPVPAPREVENKQEQEHIGIRVTRNPTADRRMTAEIRSQLTEAQLENIRLRDENAQFEEELSQLRVSASSGGAIAAAAGDVTETTQDSAADGETIPGASAI